MLPKRVAFFPAALINMIETSSKSWHHGPFPPIGALLRPTGFGYLVRSDAALLRAESALPCSSKTSFPPWAEVLEQGDITLSKDPIPVFVRERNSPRANLSIAPCH